MSQTNQTTEGILPVNKPRGQTAFNLIRRLRKLLHVQKIGHAGTLDPFATGVMIFLIGRKYTRLSDSFLNSAKAYTGRIHLGIATDTFDCEGKEISRSSITPTLLDIENALGKFQGEIEQVPPMFSAKKVSGKKLYEYARKGIVVDRKPELIKVETLLTSYQYPYLDIAVTCSKGTYIRSLAHDIGITLGCGGHLTSLNRIQSGNIFLQDCFDGMKLFSNDVEPKDLISCLKLQ